MGMNALERNDYDKAIAEFTEETRSNPKDAATYNNRGYAYIMKGELDLAIADFEKSLKIKPGNKDAMKNLDKARKRLENETQTQQQPPASTVSSGSYAPVTNNAPAAPAAAVDDELDVAIRDASDYLNDNIPKGNKIVILNIESNAANLSEYIIDELIANAVNDKNFSVVDRRQLETIRSEQKFQMSGAVDDKDALAIGKFFGAQTIISGAMRDIGSRYRMTIRALSVQTAQVQGQYNRNMVISETLAALANSGGAYSRPSVAATTTSGRTTQAATPAAAHRATPAAPAIKGTPVPGNKLTEKLDWLQENVESGGNYLIELNANETISPKTLAYEGKSKITITIVGVGENRSIFLSSNGHMFVINADVTLVLENNVTLQGRSQNNGSLVYVNGGALIMNAGATITGNITSNDGGGIYVNTGTFTMNGGTISDNTARNGGGVYVNAGTFTMNDGTISDNTVNDYGGGVYVADATFNMRGGTITGNTAGSRGGGVYYTNPYWSNVKFNKSGGTITGYASDADNGNRAMSSQKGGGHAVCVSNAKRKETTAGPSANLSLNNNSYSGAWDGD
jgi:TolB-like protein